MSAVSVDQRLVTAAACRFALGRQADSGSSAGAGSTSSLRGRRLRGTTARAVSCSGSGALASDRPTATTTTG